MTARLSDVGQNRRALYNGSMPFSEMAMLIIAAAPKFRTRGDALAHQHVPLWSWRNDSRDAIISMSTGTT